MTMTKDIGHRLKSSPSADQLAIPIHLIRGQWTVVVRVEMDPVHPQGLRQQELRIQTRGARALIAEIPGGRLDDLCNGPPGHQQAPNGERSDLGGRKLLGTLVGLESLSELAKVSL